MPIQWGYHRPVVFRYLERCYVDRFFETGELRLSSFATFATHKDEHRQDSEGKNLIVGRGPNSTTYAVVEHGSDALVLCGSASRNPKLFRTFNTDAAIQIFNTTGFGQAVASKIAALKFGLEGHCYYTNFAIETKVDDHLLRGVQSGQYSINTLLAAINTVAGTGVYFRKRLRYRRQHEYRWVWVGSSPAPATLTIEVPEARRFCLPAYRDELAPSFWRRLRNRLEGMAGTSKTGPNPKQSAAS